jgi:hypothetical protein
MEATVRGSNHRPKTNPAHPEGRPRTATITRAELYCGHKKRRSRVSCQFLGVPGGRVPTADFAAVVVTLPQGLKPVNVQ